MSDFSEIGVQKEWCHTLPCTNQDAETFESLLIIYLYHQCIVRHFSSPYKTELLNVRISIKSIKIIKLNILFWLSLWLLPIGHDIFDINSVLFILSTYFGHACAQRGTHTEEWHIFPTWIKMDLKMTLNPQPTFAWWSPHIPFLFLSVMCSSVAGPGSSVPWPVRWLTLNPVRVEGVWCFHLSWAGCTKWGF